MSNEAIDALLAKLALAQRDWIVSTDRATKDVLIEDGLKAVLDRELKPLLLAGREARYAALGHSHWDDTMQRGKGCTLCIQRNEANQKYDAAWDAALKQRAES